MAEKKEKRYVSDDARLMAEWDWEKNNELMLDPNAITWKSDKKAWWLCSVCGYSWKSTVKNRSNGKGCPYCAGQKVWKGYNDLATINPKLAREWHPTKNSPLTPEEITANSGQKVWWLCNEGHEWETTIDNRNSGSLCPYCSGRLPIKGKTDLATTNPELAAEWHPKKNGSLLPTMVSLGAHKKAWWLCNKGHEWQAVIYSRKISGCPICTREKKTSFPEQVVFFYMQQITTAYNRYITDSRTEIDVYLPELQIGIEYDGAFFHKGEESFLREKRKDTQLSQQGITLIRIKEKDGVTAAESLENIIYCQPYPNFSELKKVLDQLILRINIISNSTFAIDVNVNRDRGKIYAQYVEGEKENSLYEVNFELAGEWHPYKNETLSPRMVTANSEKKVWWQCKNGHEWQATIHSRNRGNGCPYCGGFFAVRGVNDLATVNPRVAQEWHPYKNEGISLLDLLPQSNKVVWWLCSQGHEWRSMVCSRSNGSGCPYCSNFKVLEGYNDIATTHPQLVSEWHPNKNHGLFPSMFVAGSDKKVWWKCSTCEHEWEARISKRTSGRGCPECAKKKRGVEYSYTALLENGSLADHFPDIAEQWHPTKNREISPAMVTSRTKKEFWWKCSEGHEWEASVESRTRTKGCPICSGRRTVAGINDLETKMPELAKQWHPSKNGELQPYNVTAGSGKKVWWVCNTCGYEWEAIIGNRSKGAGCPKCAKRKK